MSDEMRWSPYEEEPPWEWLVRIARQAWQRIRPRPPKLTGADLVPEGADPICPRCILPHHPLASTCPHCGEIVNRWAPWMPYVWILVWGRAMWRILETRRLSLLICVGLVASGVGYVVTAAGLWGGIAPAGADMGRLAAWLTRPMACLGPFVPAYLAAGFRLVEVAVQRWRSWNLADDPGDHDSQPEGSQLP